MTTTTQYTPFKLPTGERPQVPNARTLWFRSLVVAFVALVFYLLNELTYVLLDLWLLESLGFADVFWTNFRTGAILFVIGVLGVGTGIAMPTLMNDIHPGWRRLLLLVALLVGLIGGYLMANEYELFLQLLNGQPFGETDPVFGNDIGFYVFSLPAIWVIWTAVTMPFLFGVVVSVFCAIHAHGRRGGDSQDAAHGIGRLTMTLGLASTPKTLMTFGALGIASAVGIWLSRYDLLLAENEDETIFAGAQYVDVAGLFSYLNYYYVSTFVVLAVTILSMMALRRLHDTVTGSPARAQGASSKNLWLGVVALIAFDFVFAGLITVREVVSVTPNEPVIQLPYIQRHIDATLKGYNLGDVETVSFVPNDIDDPLPTADELLNSTTLKNVPLWPGWVSYLERVLDPQHVNRVLQNEGDPVIYGPVMDIFRQQQKLRTYYDFLGVDTVRYKANGETTMYVSAVRELPMQDPQPWLYAWGQRFLLYTHGYGLVMARSAGLRGEGEPDYASYGLPPRAIDAALNPENPAIYYGEGSSTMAYSNANDIKELDYPTDEGRAEVMFSLTEDAGVRMDSLLKRFVIAWRSGVVLDVLLSDLIDPDTRAHYYRMPLERLDRIIPFLFLDSNSYAVAAQGGIQWIVNAIATTDMYPYSRHEALGDKSNDRSPFERPDRDVNYLRDSVKAVINAYSGKVSLYKIDDDPVIETWARIYPGLFAEGDDMPADIRAHLMYPPQMFHLQFDNIYKRYHMTDAMTYFNMEDLWDDADEVKGPILDKGEAITFSIEPFNWLADTGTKVLPVAKEPTQFTMSMVFTNEKALNLRAIPMVYQDGDDYGRLIILQVPKGHFHPSPMQTDAAIDQEPEISEQISWWNRTGADVIHGHTNTLVIGNEVVYVAPLFIRSQQNQFSQIKRVIVVFRGHPADGNTLREALERAINKARQAQKQKGAPLIAAAYSRKAMPD